MTVAVLLLATLAGCGRGGGSTGPGGSIGPASDTYVYVSNAGNRTVAAFQVNTDTGALKALSGSPFPFIGSVPARVTTDPQGRLLFVADGSSSSFSVYRIDPVTGILTSVGTTAIPAVPQDLAADTAADFVFVLSPTQISGFRFDSVLGTITPVLGSPFPVGSGAGTAAGQRLTIDAAGRFLYVTNLVGILSYRIAGDGSLTLVSQLSEPGAGLTGIASDPVGHFLYAASPVSGAGRAGGVFGFSTDSSGTLTPLSGSPFPAGPGMRELTMDKAGRFVAVAGSALGVGIISFFTVDPATGTLTQVPQSPFSSSPDPVQLTIDALGRFVYSANADLSASPTSGSGNVSGFTIDSRTTSLTPVSGSPFAITAPAGVVSVRPAP